MLLNPPGLSTLAGESGGGGGGVGAVAGDTLKQFHAASSSLKSMCTGFVAAGIEDCRKACGGHGFLQSSGLPEFLGSYLQSCTVEGENHMLTQQVVRGRRLLCCVFSCWRIQLFPPSVKQTSFVSVSRVVGVRDKAFLTRAYGDASVLCAGWGAEGRRQKGYWSRNDRACPKESTVCLDLCKGRGGD